MAYELRYKNPKSEKIYSIFKRKIKNIETLRKALEAAGSTIIEIKKLEK